MKSKTGRALLLAALLLILVSSAAISQTLTGAPDATANGAIPATPVASAAPAPAPAAWLNPVISAIAGLLGAFIGGYFATRNAKAAIIQKTNELEIESIDKRIGDFIAPFEQLSLENLKLARELRRDREKDNFRTLLALLDPSWKQGLSKGDRAIVDAIVQNGGTLRQMILEHGSSVSTAIRPHLAAASMHFRFLALADAGSLEMNPTRYDVYVYPRQLDEVLVLERRRLEARRELLRSQPDIAHGAIEDLIIPKTRSLPEI